jgi:NitT/TauT family transport system substrate-binding protein
MRLTRRNFVGAVSLASAAGAAGLVSSSFADAPEERPEIETLRLATQPPAICIAPEYIADELLRAEGFTRIDYIASTTGAPVAKAVAEGSIDFCLNYAAPNIVAIEAGKPIVNLAGIHVGCFELFAHEGIQGVADLKGKRVGVQALGSSQHVYLATMLSYIGLDPAKDIQWVTGAFPAPVILFAEGKVDAYLGFAPEPQDLRARKIGHVIVNSAVDRPWAQYFCCMATGNRDFVQRYPIATKKALRAILRATDICVSQPARVARQIVDGGATPSYEYASQALAELPYNRWREFDPDDTLRFYALRLREAGMIKSTPQNIIAKGTDWRFLNEIKRELGI